MKKFLIFLLLIAGYLSSANSVIAQYGAYEGGTPSQDILVDKLVGKITSFTKGGVAQIVYVDNLSAGDKRFSPGQDIMFKIKVKNISSKKINNVIVDDFVPSYVTPIEGPGSFDEATRRISFNAGDFDPDQTKEFTIKMRALPLSDLPADQSIFCPTNKVRATGETSADEDTSQFCIEKFVAAGVSTVPSAGPEFGIILLSGEVLALGTGIYLRKSSSK
ncbi:MAG: hypothetical protein QHH09_02440 [Microgenomates group bacterium]|nr:hypothetical protein [Microgenomates group bacterium]